MKEVSIEIVMGYKSHLIWYSVAIFLGCLAYVAILAYIYCTKVVKL